MRPYVAGAPSLDPGTAPIFPATSVSSTTANRASDLRIKDMVKSNWVYRKLRNFRAGIESDISCLKRAFGLARCIWRGITGTHAPAAPGGDRPLIAWRRSCARGI
jgi:IS5 family transposase